MRILMMAPVPFYQERGTPIAIDLLLKSLSEQGHQVDVITYPEGVDRDYDGVSYFRVKPFGEITGVRPGFSLKKIYLDLFVLVTFIRLFFSKKYDVVHAVEESVFMAMVISPLKRIPYIYDMDSSMVTQLLDKAPSLKFLETILRFIESLPARFATVVVPCCDALSQDVARYRGKKNKATLVLKDISLLDKSRTDASSGLDVRGLVSGQGEPKKVLMYIGNLESYQGIDLMIDGFAEACKTLDNIALVVVGGEDQDIDFYKKSAKDLGVAESTFFLGKQPVSDLYALMFQSDILLSPRTQGANTPMKVYSYLDSNVPVIATRLPTHTQVMSDENTLLVDADDKSFAKGVVRLVEEPSLGLKLTQNAAELIEREHSWSSFDNAVKNIYSVVS